MSEDGDLLEAATNAGYKELEMDRHLEETRNHLRKMTPESDSRTIVVVDEERLTEYARNFLLVFYNLRIKYGEKEPYRSLAEFMDNPDKIPKEHVEGLGLRYLKS